MPHVGRAVLAATMITAIVFALSALSSRISVENDAAERCVGASCPTLPSTAAAASPDPDVSGPIKKVDCKKWFGREGTLKYGDTCWRMASPSPSPSPLAADMAN